MDPGAFFARQLYSVATSTKGRIVIGGFVTPIARFFNVIPDDNDWVSGFERLDKSSFKLMSFCKVKAGRLCWIYLWGSAYTSS